MRRVPVALVVVASIALALGGGRVGTAGAAAEQPVRVMTIGDFKTTTSANPAWSEAVTARFESLSLAGGLADARGRRHPVEVIACNTASDPDRALVCAHRAVRARVAAVVGMSAVDSDVIWPVVQRARIPVIGARVVTLEDVVNPMSFPLGSGLPGVSTAAPQLLARFGATRIGVVMSDFGAATDTLVGYIEQGTARANATLTTVVRVAVANPDLEGAARTIVASGADGIVGFVAGGPRGAVIAELARAGYGGWYATQAPVGSVALASDPDDTQQALVVGQFAPVTSEAPGMRRFREDMAEASHGADLARTEGAVNAWAAAWLFERICRGLDRIDASTVRQALRELRGFDMGGITPPLTTVTGPTTELHRLFNPTVTFNRSTAGSTTSIDGTFVQPFTSASR